MPSATQFDVLPHEMPWRLVPPVGGVWVCHAPAIPLAELLRIIGVLVVPEAVVVVVAPTIQQSEELAHDTPESAVIPDGKFALDHATPAVPKLAFVV